VDSPVAWAAGLVQVLQQHVGAVLTDTTRAEFDAHITGILSVINRLGQVSSSDTATPATASVDVKRAAASSTQRAENHETGRWNQLGAVVQFDRGRTALPSINLDHPDVVSKNPFMPTATATAVPTGEIVTKFGASTRRGSAVMVSQRTWKKLNTVSPKGPSRKLAGGPQDRLGPFCTAAVERVEFVDADADGGIYWIPETHTGGGKKRKSHTINPINAYQRGVPDKHAATGVLSVCTPLTAAMTAAFKTKLPVAPGAVKFAFAHPIGSTAGSASCTKAQMAQLLRLPLEVELKFVLQGGFIFFDEAGCIVSALAITDTKPTREQDRHLAFEGPYDWCKEWSAHLTSAQRVHPITIPELRALGLRRFAWLQPNESFLADAGGGGRAAFAARTVGSYTSPTTSTEPQGTLR
jgi:hypothetical protein